MGPIYFMCPSVNLSLLSCIPLGVAEGVATLEYRNTRSGYLLTYVPKYIYQVSR